MPNPPTSAPPSAPPLPATAFNILGLNDARPPIEETKLGMLPDLIAPKTFPIPVNRPSFTPNMLEAKTNPAAMPFGFDLSSIKDKASAINC